MRLLIISICLVVTQLLFSAVCLAEEGRNCITGFVFHDNNANGYFDDGDNVFPTAIIYVESIDSSQMKSVHVSANGYFEVADLASDNYVVYAEYYGHNSRQQEIQFDVSTSHANIAIGIEPITVELAEPDARLLRNNDSSVTQTSFNTIMLPVVMSQ